MRQEADPPVFPGRGYNELMPGYGFLKARRIVLILFPQGLNRPYIHYWARLRLQLGAAAMLAASPVALPSLVPAGPLCARLYCSVKEAPRSRGTQWACTNSKQVTDWTVHARSQTGLCFSCYVGFKVCNPSFVTMFKEDGPILWETKRDKMISWWSWKWCLVPSWNPGL